MRDVEAIAPLFLKHPHRSLETAGQLVWVEDEQFDIEHHVRHSALPKPGRVRELLDLCSRLHGTRLARERPLWEAHVIEGLRDGRVAIYTKIHHALVDGVSAMRLLQSVLSTDPDQRDMPAPWAARPRPPRATKKRRDERAQRGADDGPADRARHHRRGRRDARRPGQDAAPAACERDVRAVALRPADDPQPDDHRLPPLRRAGLADRADEGIGKATGTTINDVVLAMCSGAMRTYLTELDALPDSSLVSMVPVGLNAKQSQLASAEGGNAVGSIMVKLGTDLADPASRLSRPRLDARRQGVPVEHDAGADPGDERRRPGPGHPHAAAQMQGIVRPPYNLIISNVPGPRTTHYLNGAQLLGTYPLSIPINGMALNITCTSYDGNMCFGLTGCRRTLPHLQRLLTHLDDELAALEKAAGILGENVL